jgi:hypothetical protein
MASYGQEIPSVKGKPKKEDSITIMIMRSVGKVRSFKIAPLFLYLLTVFLLLNIVATIYFGNRFFDLRHVESLQSEKIKQMENEASKNQKTIHRNQQHMAILEEYIRNIENPKERKSSSGTNIFLPQKSVEREPERVTKNLTTVKTEEAAPPVVDIKDVAIKKEGSKMRVNFRVVNLRELDNPIGGYIHLIAVGKDGYSPSAWTFPNEELRDGVPVDFRRGQLFLIQRFKPIQGNFFLSSNADPPAAVKVLVYNQTGTLLLEREFEVSDGS